MKYFIFLITLILVSCTTSQKTNDEAEAISSTTPRKPFSGMGVTIEASDIYFDAEDTVAHFDIFGQCLKGKSSITLKHQDYKFAVPCQNDTFRHRFNFTKEDIKNIRKSKKDHHLYVQAYHGNNEGGKAKIHMFLGYQDFQVKLMVTNTVRFFEDTQEKPITQIEVFGACKAGSQVDLVVDDESKSLEVFHKKETCTETGFNYVDQIVGELRPDTFFQAAVTSEAGDLVFAKRFPFHGVENKARIPTALLPPPEMKLKPAKSTKKTKK